MKKLTSIILTALILISVFAIGTFSVGAITSGDYHYVILDDGTARIIHYNGSDTKVTIPNEIDGHTVTELARGSFSMSSKNFDNISIPASVVDIQPGAFKLCGVEEIFVDSANLYYTSENGVLFNKDKTALLAYPINNTQISYTIPNSVKTIEYAAFMFGSNLSNVIIPNTVTSINEEAFSYCSNLKDIEIPNSVTQIGINAFDFSMCNKESGGYYIGNCLIGADNDFCGNFSIKEGTRLVADEALKEKYSIESITVPSSVEVVGDYAFLQFSFEGGYEDEFKSILKNINIAEDNKNFCSIDGVMFNKDKTELLYYPCGKENITYTVPNTVKKLGKVSFSSCQLESLKLPDNLKSIGESAFQYSSLKNITIPQNVEYLGKYAFDRSALEIIDIPSSITVIEEGCFELCGKLKSVSFKGNIKCIKDYAFDRCESLTEIDIPDSVTNIGTGAFQLTGIQKIELPNKLENIGEYAFNNCENLQELIIPNNEITISSRAFYNCPKLTNILIPNKVKEIGLSAFGYEGDIFDNYDEYGSENVINNFKIQGYSETTAETYASENSIEFISLGNIPILLGDVNADSKINITDATEIQKYLVQLVNFDDTQKSVADTNGDGKVNITDVTQIQKYIAQLVTLLG